MMHISTKEKQKRFLLLSNEHSRFSFAMKRQRHLIGFVMSQTVIENSHIV